MQIRMFGRYRLGVSGVWLFFEKSCVWVGFQVGATAFCLVVLGPSASSGWAEGFVKVLSASSG